ncbi:MAG: hypothetical protein HGA45_35855 [Chloroflexales bacterium]|nr:hypothetical protein [Chloroflexales bacterium]
MDQAYVADNASSLEELPEELHPWREEIAACLRARKRWMLEPTSTEHATWVPARSSVKGQPTWAKTAYVSGYEVARDGTPSKILWSYDGAWARSDEMELSDPAFAAWDQEETGAGLQQRADEGWHAYSVWVAEHGEDPLGAFTVSPWQDTSWEVAVAWLVEEGLTLLSGRPTEAAKGLLKNNFPLWDGRRSEGQ